jgi:hypothetical protein
VRSLAGDQDLALAHIPHHHAGDARAGRPHARGRSRAHRGRSAAPSLGARGGRRRLRPRTFREPRYTTSIALTRRCGAPSATPARAARAPDSKPTGSGPSAQAEPRPDQRSDRSGSGNPAAWSQARSAAGRQRRLARRARPPIPPTAKAVGFLGGIPATRNHKGLHAPQRRGSRQSRRLAACRRVDRGPTGPESVSEPGAAAWQRLIYEGLRDGVCPAGLRDSGCCNARRRAHRWSSSVLASLPV